MFKQSTKKLATLSLALAFCSQQTARPISETTATVCAIGGGAVSGALAGYGIHYLAKKNGYSNTTTWLLTGLGSATAGVGAGALIYYIMSKYTPTGRFAYAQGIIAELYADPIIAGAHDGTEHLIARITSAHGTSWPLVAARENLMRQSVNLGSAATALDMAYTEAKANPGRYPEIMQNYQQLRASIPHIYHNIEHVLNIITNNEKYDSQVQLFERHMEQVRQQQHELALQGNQLSHERWENYQDRDHDSREKNKDRIHQSNESSKKYYYKYNDKREERDYKRQENHKDRVFAASRPNTKINFSMGGR